MQINWSKAQFRLELSLAQLSPSSFYKYFCNWNCVYGPLGLFGVGVDMALLTRNSLCQAHLQVSSIWTRTCIIIMDEYFSTFLDKPSGKGCLFSGFTKGIRKSLMFFAIFIRGKLYPILKKYSPLIIITVKPTSPPTPPTIPPWTSILETLLDYLGCWNLVHLVSHSFFHLSNSKLI